MKSVRVVMPVYGQWHLAEQALASLLRQEPWCGALSVHVIDNCSPTPPPTVVSTMISANKWVYERTPKNLGVTIPWNMGVRRALADGADVICVSNSDVVFGRSVVRECVRCLEQSGRGVCFPNSIQGGPMPADFAARDAALVAGAKTTWRDTNGFAGWCFFVDRSVFEAVGIFDERFVLWYQDTNFFWRVRHVGHVPTEVTSCLLHHFESRTILSMPNGFGCYGWRTKDEAEWKKWVEEWKVKCKN